MQSEGDEIVEYDVKFQDAKLLENISILPQ
jgi:hypothetical protein